MFNHKVKFTLPHIDNKINIDTINNKKKIFPLRNNAQNNIMTSDIMQRISLQIGDRVMVKQRKLNKLTPIFQSTSYTVINAKGTLYTLSEKKKPGIKLTGLNC